MHRHKNMLSALGLQLSYHPAAIGDDNGAMTKINELAGKFRRATFYTAGIKRG